MYIKDYPNLELLEYKTKEYLKLINPEYCSRQELIADVFAQSWASTALGFPGCGGSAITTTYTSVFRDLMKGIAVVYFGDRLAYIIENVEDDSKFLEDLGRRCLASVTEAQSRYGKVLTSYVE